MEEAFAKEPDWIREAGPCPSIGGSVIPEPRHSHVLLHVSDGLEALLCMGTEEECMDAMETVLARVKPEDTLRVQTASPSDSGDWMKWMEEDAIQTAISRNRHTQFRKYSQSKGQDYDHEEFKKRVEFVSPPPTLNREKLWVRAHFWSEVLDETPRPPPPQLRRFQMAAPDQCFAIAFPVCMFEEQHARGLERDCSFEAAAELVRCYETMARTRVWYHSVYGTRAEAEQAGSVLLEENVGWAPRVIPLRCPQNWVSKNWQIVHHTPSVDPLFRSLLDKALTPAQWRAARQSQPPTASADKPECSISGGPSGSEQ